MATQSAGAKVGAAAAEAAAAAKNAGRGAKSALGEWFTNIGSRVKAQAGKDKEAWIARQNARKAAQEAIENGAAEAPDMASRISNVISPTLTFMKTHPFQSAGLGILGGANIAGLVDNDKFGGQLGGAALGALTSAGMHYLGGVSGVPLAWAPMIGGALGALFDKSREAKEQQRLAMMQYQNQYN